MIVSIKWDGYEYYLTEQGISELPSIYRLLISELKKLNVLKLCITN